MPRPSQQLKDRVTAGAPGPPEPGRHLRDARARAPPEALSLRAEGDAPEARRAPSTSRILRAELTGDSWHFVGASVPSKGKGRWEALVRLRELGEDGSTRAGDSHRPACHDRAPTPP